MLHCLIIAYQAGIKGSERGVKIEDKNNTGLYGLQTKKLQLNKRKEEPSGQNGNEEIL